MKQRICWATAIVAAGLLSSGASAGEAAISGKVNFKGGKEAAPKRTVIQMSADPNCISARAGKKAGSETVIVNKDGTLRNVAVYIKSGLDGQTFEVPPPVILDQDGCMYKPHIVTCMKGQTLTVRNSDGTLHNIHGTPQKNPGFNFGQPKAGMTKNVTFDYAEIIPVKCDVHSWMKSYIVVLEHPFHDVTKKDGAFSLASLPAGEYVVAAWHEEFGEITQKVTVADGATTEITFEFEKK